MKIPSRFLLLAAALLGAAPFPLVAADAPATVPVQGAAAPTPTQRFLRKGDVAPEFSVVDAKGAAVKLSDFRGKVVIVDVSATWCGPCQAAMPNNDRVFRKYADQGVVLLGITADDTKAAYDGWIARNAEKYKFQMYFDPKGKDGWNESVFNTQYHITGFPTMFVIDRNGVIGEVVSGGGPGEDYRLEYALARLGVKVDLASIPPEPKKDPDAPKSIPASTKTMAMPAAGGMIGMGGAAPAKREVIPSKFGTIASNFPVPDFTVIGANGSPLKLSSFAGKPVLVHFVSGGMGPQAWFTKILADYKDGNYATLVVFAATERADFDKWVAANPNPGYTVAWDPAGKAWAEGVTNTTFGVGMFPASLVVTADGKLVSGFIGMGEANATMIKMMLASTGAIKPNEADVAAMRERVQAVMGAGGMAPAMAAPAGPRPPFSEKYGKLKAGDVVPDFTVTTVDGKTAKFSDYAKGKVVVLDFWATWCGPCQQAMPHYEEMHRKYGPKGVVFLGVCGFDTRENYDKWVATNKDKYTFTTVFDPVGKPASGDKEAMAKTVMMQVSGGAMTPLPTTLVINAEGKLVGNYVGYGAGTHEGLANLLMLAGVTLNPEDKPKQFFPAGSTLKAAVAAAPAPAPAAPALLDAGAVAPDFVMRDINDKEVKLSDFKGKVVVLDFWATWCGPCIASMPHTNEVAGKYADQDVIVVASGTSDTIAKFKEWIPKNQPKYPHIQFYFDPNERGSETFEQRASAKLYHVSGIPTQFVIGRDGKIVATIVGNGGKEDPRTEGALAKAGVKVDPEIVKKGYAALDAEVAQRKAAAAAAADELVNPKPAFREAFGKLKAGEPVTDIPLQTADGQATTFAQFTKGKTVVFTVWSGNNGPFGDGLAFTEAWSKKYADQGVMFLGMASYASREAFDQWRTAQAGKFSFPVVWDPAGAAPKPAKPLEEMTDADKLAFRDESRAYFQKNGAMVFTGGVMAPVPNNTVVDSQGRMLGFYVGAGAGTKDSLANLLLRAGVKLAPEDMPKKVFSTDDTKEQAPEPRVEMLKVGAAAPDFPATDVDGKAIKVSDFRGKVVILDFWATWCGPCLASMPHTQEVAAKYKDQGVVVMASCTSDARLKFEAWVKANQGTYPDIKFSHDPLERDPSRAARKLYGVGGIPQQFIIDREGKVAALVTGYLKGEALLDAALAKAGIKVDPALIEQAVQDQKKRDMMR
jgi:thiol-disulfide isomerase/thioredoxin